MESDSDSDGSHVSATPPRESKPPSPPRAPAPSFSNKGGIGTVASSMSSRSKLTSKPPRSSSSCRPAKSPQKNDCVSDQHDSLLDAFPLPSFPFLIRHPSEMNRPASSTQSIENLPAGFFSRSTSFSKIRRSVINFNIVDEDVPQSLSSSSQTKGDNYVTDCLPADSVPPEVKSEAKSCKTSRKVFSKHHNVIGGGVAMPPVKLRKCSGEGNFVKLNLNGKKHKFSSKGKKKGNCVLNGRRYCSRGKKKFKAGGGPESESIYDEEGLITETKQTKQSQESGRSKLDAEMAAADAILMVRNEPSDDNLRKLLKLTHGYDSFRDGQLEAIQLVLAGKSTMLVLPTGSGKSLCYQIPAMILPGITLVVSPLVALMIDQLKQLPHGIQGGLLCSTQRPEEVSETLSLLRQGTMKVLFVSPERFLNADFLSMFSTSLPISLVVVDEAHCISEWSHNFRPAYMRLRASFLRDQLNINCVLAMTATATTSTLHAVISALEIAPDNLILKSTLPKNLQLSLSTTKNRSKDLLALIKSPPFSKVRSIIIYCKFQYDTDIISKCLCDNNISSKSYHSGLPANDRHRIQELFCSNKIRVVVATVAFGMGLDKRDVGAVIHLSLPESLEEYVQEIGRAGRDGSLSYCHLFLDDDIYFKLRSLMHSDGVDEYVVNKFLSQIFIDDINSCGKMCSLVKESASLKFDMKAEVIFTLLTHLELGEVQYLQLLPQSNVSCTLSFHKTSPVLLAENDIIVAELLKQSEIKQGQYKFNIPAVVNGTGVTATDLTNHLQSLKLKGEIMYELKDMAFCYTILEIPSDFCSLSAHLTRWLSEIESCKVRKLDTMYNAAAFALNLCNKMDGCSGDQHTPCFQKKISCYFNDDVDFRLPDNINQNSPFLKADIKVFLRSNSQAKFTPRAIARIMHGIGSPTYPSSTWSRTHFWGRYRQLDFEAVMEAAKQELINFAGKDPAAI